MALEVKEITEMEKKVIVDRKKLILEKMDFYYDFYGFEDTDAFLDFLENDEFINFVCGQVIEFNKFKKYYLTSIDRINEFHEIFYNSALDESEFYFVGFKDDIRLVPEDKLYTTFFECIMDYEFGSSDLIKFERFVDSKYNKCCDFYNNI